MNKTEISQLLEQIDESRTDGSILKELISKISGTKRAQERTEFYHEISSFLKISRDRSMDEERKRSREELKSSEQMLQAIFNSITDPLILMDRNARIRNMNVAAMEYYSIFDIRQMLGKKCHQAFYGRVNICKECTIPGDVHNRKNHDFIRTKPDNPEIKEKVSLYAVAGNMGMMDATVVRITNITERELLKKRVLLNDKLASIGVLSTGIAHEINNPNNFISLNIPILKDYIEKLLEISDQFAENKKDFQLFYMDYADFREDIFTLLENMEYGSTRINEIVSELKSFARGSENDKLIPVDIATVIQKALLICRGKIGKTIKDVIIEINPQLEEFHSNPDILEQVLINLLINAEHAVDKDNSEIKIIVTQNDKKQVIIEVMDNGSGMTDEISSKIFDPFFSTKSLEDGTGLGLYISYNLIKKINGRLDVDSWPGKGSIFRITLKQARETEIFNGL